MADSVTLVFESVSKYLQTSQSGCLAFARWPQSSCPDAGSGTSPRRGTAASTNDRETEGGDPGGGGGGTLSRTTRESVVETAATLVGEETDTVATA